MKERGRMMAEEMDKGQLQDNVPHIIALALLIFILLITLTRFGYVRCDQVPGFCGIYYRIFGRPEVAIIHGEGAIGNPKLLEQSIIESETIFPAYIHIDNLQTVGILEHYDIVIVEGPRQIPTQTLKVFANYVQRGGKLVWVGDAGIELGEDDYVCRTPMIHYIPSMIVYEEGNESNGEVIEQCGEWVTLSAGHRGGLNHPEKLESGICGKSFGEIVVKFIEMNNSVYRSATEGSLGLCSDVEEPYIVENADGITRCIQTIKSEGKEVNASSVNEICTFESNNWNRGPSLTEAGEVIKGYDFSSGVLGLTYTGREDPEKQNLMLNPINRHHWLSSGYSVQSQLYFGQSDFTKVDASRFPLRNEVVFTLEDAAGKNWPAVIVSNPVGPSIGGKGNVVYFAFPPEIGYQHGAQGRGSRLLSNIFHFLVPL